MRGWGRWGAALLIGALSLPSAAKCTSSPLDGDVMLSESASRLIEAFECDDAALEKARADKPASTAAMAASSDAVITGAIQVVDVSESGSSVVATIDGLDAEGGTRTVTLELWPSSGTTADDAAKAIPVGADLVVYATEDATWCGTEVEASDTAVTPVSPYGLIIALGDTAKDDELVWPLLRRTSWAPLEEAPLGGSQDRGY
ncbi:MAG: hypothetical protein QM611_09005 [Microbacterium sp.]|uniref:hypothetical protein n=1 Tax=Microbacterium sp. TaxID=51671 RepID=UPI0039E21D28